MKLNEVTYAIVDKNGVIHGDGEGPTVGYHDIEMAKVDLEVMTKRGDPHGLVIRAVKLVPVNRTSDPVEVHHWETPTPEDML